MSTGLDHTEISSIDTLQAGSAKEVIRAVPLLIRKIGTNYHVYAYVLSTGNYFDTKGGPDKYAWLVLSSNNNQLTLVARSNLWAYELMIPNVTADKTGIPEGTTCYLTEAKELAPLRVHILDNSVTPDIESTILATVDEGYTRYVDKLNSSPLEKVPFPLPPSGVWRKYWLKINSSVRFRHSHTKAQLQRFLSSSSKVFDVHSKLNQAKEVRSFYGNLEMKDSEVIYRNTKGEVISNTTKLRVKATHKTFEYPFCKPSKFSLNKKSFTAALDTTASSIIKPIKLWTESVADVETYAIAAILAIWSTIRK